MRGRPYRAVAVTTLSALLLTGCTLGDVPTEAAPSAAPEGISVTTRDLTSVLVVEGAVVASPEVLIAATTAGTVEFDDAALGDPSLNENSPFGSVGGAALTLPFAGRIVAPSVPDGSDVVANAPVATAAYAGFGVMVRVPAEQLYRLYTEPTTALVSLTAGAAGITCALHPLAEASSPDQLPAFACLLPPDTSAVPGLSARVGIETASAPGVVAVPVSAVLGSSESGVVTVIDGSDRERRDIRLGISDGSFVEVVSGLEVGETISSVAPDLRP